MNPSQDRYSRIVAQVLHISPDEVTKEQRAFAKDATFGAQSEEDALAMFQIFLTIATQDFHG